MPIVKIKIADKNFTLSCQEGNQEYIQNLASKLDAQIRGVGKNNRLASLEMLLIMVSLDLLDNKYSSASEITKQETKTSSLELNSLHEALKNIANKFNK